MIDRRRSLTTVAGLSLLAGFRWLRGTEAHADDTTGAKTGDKAAAMFEIEKTPEEWRRQLTAAQYDILRDHGTERPYSSPLNKEHRKGIFACAGCDLPLFSSDTKFDSHTGWPSFYRPLADAVATTEDRSFMMKRTEVHCRRCGGHLGHVFDDGPKPTGLRYCMNGLSLVFRPAPSTAS